MSWQATVWTPILVATAIVSFGLSAYVLFRHADRDRPIVASFLGLSLSAGVWSLAYALQLSTTTLSAKLFWNRFVWIGAATMMLAWPAFVLVYTGHERWVRGGRLALLSAVPAAVLLAVWIGGASTYLYLDPAVETIGRTDLLTFEPGGALLIALGYAYAINLATYGLLVSIAFSRTGTIRHQATILLIAGVVPTVAGVVGNTGLIVSQFIDLTPMAFLVTTPVVAWALFRYRLLDLSPIAREVLFADISDGVIVVDEGGTIVDANGAARSWFGDRLVGGSIEGAIGTTATETLRERTDDSPDGISTEGSDGSNESSIRRLTVGTEHGDRTFDVSVSPLRHRGISGTVFLFRDVTDRERLQRRYRALVEKAPNVVLTVDECWTIRYVAPSIERILGYEPAGVVGRSVLAYVHPDDANAFDDGPDELLDAAARKRNGGGAADQTVDPTDRVRIEHRLRHADGTWRQFETTMQPLSDGEYVLTATDVTEQRRYEQRLQVLNRVLRHDLNNDMNVIAGYADLLEAHLDPAGEEYLDTIRSKADRMIDLSKRAREIDVALHSESELERADLAVAVRTAVDRLEAAFPSATVHVDTPDSAVARVHRLYESAIDNVLENAVEHSDRSNPTLEVTVESDSEAVEILVADDGPGIPQDERAVLESGRETSLEHTSGLGLWLVNWIVTRSGGELFFEENEPRGSVVRFRFLRVAETDTDE